LAHPLLLSPFPIAYSVPSRSPHFLSRTRSVSLTPVFAHFPHSRSLTPSPHAVANPDHFPQSLSLSAFPLTRPCP
jgi:hypothetical protein